MSILIVLTDLYPRERENFLNRIRNVHKLGYRLTEFTLAHPAVQKLINSNETFDLVVLEQFHNEAHMGFGAHFKAPMVLFSSIGLSEWNSHLVGDIRLPSVVPVSKTHYTDQMSFFQRLFNSIINLTDIFYKQFISFPIQQGYLDKYFPEKINLNDIIYNASLILLNSHVSTTQPTALTTASVEIGGFHISSNELPERIQRFLDEATDGAIFFSMGSNLNISNLPTSTVDDIMKAFSKLNQRILWKLEGTKFQNIPANVLIADWLPQSDILEHHNLIAFITHGGLLSVTEAVFHGVPMIGIPIFGDQRMNVARCVQKGIAVHIPLRQLNGESLHTALVEILENPMYQENARKYANIMRDRAIRPLDYAMYWIEYVLRHNGASHLKNATLELSWYQLYLIDVIVFSLLIHVLLYYLSKNVLKIFTVQKTQQMNPKKGSSKKNKIKKH